MLRRHLITDFLVWRKANDRAPEEMTFCACLIVRRLAYKNALLAADIRPKKSLSEVLRNPGNSVGACEWESLDRYGVSACPY
jgi:hypothetical protein